MAFINLVSWENSDANLYAWRYPESNLTTFTQLLVHESQEAILFSKGQIMGKFGAGKHTLSTENLPLLHKLYGLPFGKKNPFTAEVWFVNKRIPLNLDWSISKMLVSDIHFKYVPLVARGRYGLRIVLAEKFLVKLVGNLHSFSASEVTDHFQGLMEQHTKSAIVNYITQNNVGVAEISSRLNEIADSLKKTMQSFWEEYGLEIAGFFVTNIGIDEEDIAGKKILEAIASSSAQSIAGYTWQQEQAMKVANNAVSGGGDMGILGMAMFAGSLGGGGGGGGLAGMMMQPPANPNVNAGMQVGIPPKPRQGRQTVFCSNCGKTYPVTNKFCPHCGDSYNPCPVCQADNDNKSKRCVSCGAVLSSSQDMMMNAGQYCPNCQSQITVGTKFCPNCGSKIN